MNNNWDVNYNILLIGKIDEQLYQAVVSILINLLPNVVPEEYTLYPSRSIKYADITNDPHIACMLARLSFDVTLVTADPDIIRSIHYMKLMLMKHSYTLPIQTYDVIKCDIDYIWTKDNYIAYGCPILIVPITGKYPSFLQGIKLTDDWIMLRSNQLKHNNSCNITEAIQVKALPILDKNTVAEYRKIISDKLANTNDFNNQQKLLDKWYGLVDIFPHSIITTSTNGTNGTNDTQLNIQYEDMYCSSSSLIATADGYMLAVGIVNYKIDPDFTPIDKITPKPKLITQKIMLVFCDKQFKILSQQLLQDVVNFPSTINGTTDPRIIDANTILLTSRNENKEQQERLVLIHTVNNVITERKVLDKHKREIEKNWLPFMVDSKLHYVYNFNPFTIILPDNTLQIYNFDRLWRGSASPIAYTLHEQEGYLCMIHEVLFAEDSYRRYYQRWVFFTKEYTNIYFSDPFIFDKQRIQFVLSLLAEQNTIITIYSILDNSFHVALITMADIDNALIYQQVLK